MLVDPDADLVEAIDIATNLWAHPLDESPHRWAIQQWYDLYNKRNPPSTTKGRRPHGEGFAKKIENVFGVSQGHAQRLATTAEHINPEVRDVLEEAGVTQTHIDQIAALRDQKAIHSAVKVAASGVDVQEALRVGRAEKHKPAKAAPSLGKAAPALVPTKQVNMSDDEWLESHCSKMMAVLPFKTAFKRDAILYRRIAEKLIAFRTATKKARAEAHRPSENGLFYSHLFKITRASHPMHWLICNGCNGTGHQPDDKTKPCGMCLGGGYKVKFEDI